MTPFRTVLPLSSGVQGPVELVGIVLALGVTRMHADELSMTDPTAARLLDLIQAEYREMPCLCLTTPQIQRLWSLDPATCKAAIETLVTAKVLKRTARNAYVLASASRR